MPNPWSRGERRPDLAAPGLLHHLFEAHARVAPDQIAAICGTTQITYGELNARASILAKDLRARRIGRGSFVAFQLPRPIDVYVVVLGILKTGAAYVPLDPECAPERVHDILSDCKAAALLTGLLPAPEISSSRFYACGAIQAVSLGPLFGLSAMQWRYPRWDSHYLRWWFMDRLLAITHPAGLLAGDPLLNLYCRWMGARIGPNSLLASERVGASLDRRIGPRHEYPTPDRGTLEIHVAA